MEDFLKSQYKKHFLARQIVPVAYEGERQNPHSVFGAAFQQNQDLVVLLPLWDGADARENLARHMQALVGKGKQYPFETIGTRLQAAYPSSKRGLRPLS